MSGTERSWRSCGRVWNERSWRRWVKFGTESSWHNWGAVWNWAVMAQLRYSLERVVMAQMSYNLELRVHGTTEIQSGTERSWRSWGTVWNWEAMAQLSYNLELKGHGTTEVQFGTECSWRSWGTVSTFMLKGWGKGRTPANISCPEGAATRHLSNTNLVLYRFAALFGFWFSLSPSTTAVLWCCHEKALSTCRSAGRVTAHAHCTAAEQFLYHRRTPGWSPVSTFSLPAYAARRLLVTYPQCYKYPEQGMLPAAFPWWAWVRNSPWQWAAGWWCPGSSWCPLQFSPSRSLQIPNSGTFCAGAPASISGRRSQLWADTHCVLYLPATSGLTSSNVTTCSKSTTI